MLKLSGLIRESEHLQLCALLGSTALSDEVKLAASRRGQEKNGLYRHVLGKDRHAGEDGWE